ncbi:S8 family serine peptidase [Rossellomorea vietnamensis]|uniref:S8 family serine peptidase n=1 Tax=Rossellomorea vietnamensis TaxID=218284 RepID=A0A5D4KGF1_9BACI|nr:S8 family serine peptidase [Rossellomorea vietnamensis]TYR76016.1 S8 family serine peptidase [Rossellomorea vietnamensis]
MNKIINAGIISVTFILVVLTLSSGIAEAKQNHGDKIKFAVDEGNEGISYGKDEIIVKYKEKTTFSTSAVKVKHNLNIKKIDSKNNIELLKVPSTVSIKNLISDLEAHPDVDFAQPNYIYKPADLPNDPLLSMQWGLHNIGQVINNQPGVAGMDIGIQETGRYMSGLNETVVAVIDTGIDVNHPDLHGNLWVNEGEVPNNGIDDDGNGYVDDIHGWDFANNDNTVFDSFSDDRHGTHVAGIIAARKDNMYGVKGAAPNVKVAALKFISGNSGSTMDAIEAINYAKHMGFKISNNSWGREMLNEHDHALNTAIKDSGMLFVAAAGNNGKNNDLINYSPAGLPAENIISVASINNSGNLSSFSNFGVKTVDVAAPGSSILSTIPFIKAPAKTSAVFNQAEKYRTISLGFCFEDILSENSRQRVMKDLVGNLGYMHADSYSVLLINDTASENSLGSDESQLYIEALKAQGLPEGKVDRITLTMDQDGPSASVLKNYDVVIWFTGKSFGSYGISPINENDQRELEVYLSGGGNLITSGQDTFYMMEDTYFVKNVLGVKFAGEMEDSEFQYDNINPSNSTDGIRHEIQTTGSNDFLEPYIPVSTAKGLFEYSGYQNDFGYLSGTSMAAPFVSGIAATLIGGATDVIDETKRLIIDNGKTLDSLTLKIASGKLVNLESSLKDGMKLSSGLILHEDIYNTTKSIKGTAIPNSSIIVKVGKNTIATELVQSDGSFSITIPDQEVGATIKIENIYNELVVGDPLVLEVKGPAYSKPFDGIYIGGSINKYYSLIQFISQPSNISAEEMNIAGLNQVFLVQEGEIASATEILTYSGWNNARRNYHYGDLNEKIHKQGGGIFYLVK